MLVCPSGFDQLVRIQRKSRSLFADALTTQRTRDVHTLSNAMVEPWLQALLMELVLAVEGGSPLHLALRIGRMLAEDPDIIQLGVGEAESVTISLDACAGGLNGDVSVLIALDSTRLWRVPFGNIRAD
jgi:hypothetical protein